MGARVMSDCLPVCNERCSDNGSRDPKHGYDATINLEFMYYNSERKDQQSPYKDIIKVYIIELYSTYSSSELVRNTNISPHLVWLHQKNI